MKDCVYCGQKIAALARKCHYCQSFQDPKDTPKQTFELATLVISFVGSVAAIATIVAGVLAFIGFKNVDDLSKRADQISKSATTLLDSTEKKLAGFDQEIKGFVAFKNEATKNYAKTETDLKILLLRQDFARFQFIMENLRLDELHRVTDLLDQLRELSADVSSIESLPDNVKPLQSEVRDVTDAVFLYKEGQYDDVIKKLTSVSDHSLDKHRLMSNSFLRLYEQALAQKKTEDAAKLLAQEKYHAKVYFDGALRVNKAGVIARVNYASALITSGEAGDLEKALELLGQAKKESPQTSIIYYNIAVCYVRQGKFDTALDNLEQAKVRGDFASEDDIRFFTSDRDFDALRKSGDQRHQKRLAQLLHIR